MTEEQNAALVRSYRLNSTREVFRVRSGALKREAKYPEDRRSRWLVPPSSPLLNGSSMI